MAITGTWTKLLDAESLQRSSQVVSVVDCRAYVFGGELQPRTPRDNTVHIISLDQPTVSTAAPPRGTAAPPPRVGAASTTLNGKIYLFSGRGGTAMTPIDESGAIWEFDPSSSTWSLIPPATGDGGDTYPAARSYHCMASDGNDLLYVHAGCPEKGRLADLWAFNLSTRKWTELASAPDPPRGGTSIAFAAGRLYRMNGFDGTTEQGGSVDVYCPGDDAWTSHLYVADGVAGPIPRSVSVLLPVVVAGRTWVVTLFGERDPSALGHQGAGKMLGDVWAFDTENQRWTEVLVAGEKKPDPRGWFDADVSADTIVVQGGLGESNERLSDVWALQLRQRS